MKKQYPSKLTYLIHKVIYCHFRKKCLKLCTHTIYIVSQKCSQPPTQRYDFKKNNRRNPGNVETSNVFVELSKNFMTPCYGWGSTASRLQPLWGGSLLFTIKFPKIPGTHFINLGRMKGWVDLGATQWVWTRDPWIGNPVL